MRNISKKQNKKKGDWAEKIAAAYLKKCGYQVIERNFRCRQGEIDMIALDDEYLVFVEVKFRETKQYGMPGEAVDWRKQKKICRTADYYLYFHKINLDRAVRFDVIEILGNKIRLIQNAYEYHR